MTKQEKIEQNKSWKNLFKAVYFLISAIILKFILLDIYYPKSELLISKIGIISGVVVITIGALILAYDELKKGDYI